MAGLFGVVSNKNCVEDLFLGTDYHSHLGSNIGGICVYGENGFQRRIHDITRSQFKAKFYHDILEIQGNAGIGVITSGLAQPLLFKSKFGVYAIVTDGLIQNKAELVKELIDEGASFTEITALDPNATEIIAKLIAKGDTLIDGVELVFKKIKGAISMLILNHEGIYVVRDKNGHSPLAIGEGPDGMAVASETCSFPNLSYTVKKYVKPGEINLITSKGLTVIQKGGEKKKICSFLWVYTGFPASTYEGINTEIVREQCGRALAKRDTVKADQVSGVPDSGLAHAIGYAHESGVPYRRPLVKYTPGYGRSYTPPDQGTRDKIALLKLIPIKEVIDGQRIILCEDSIVRGTQLKNFTVNKLFNSGAKEVHARPACPPLIFPCIFNLSTRTTKELVARRAIEALEGGEIDDVTEYLDPDSAKYKEMMEWIAKDLGVTTLRYQRLDDMLAAIGLPKEKLCTYCWNGKC